MVYMENRVILHIKRDHRQQLTITAREDLKTDLNL